MPTLEERVAYLEGQVSDHTQTLIEIRDSIRQLERRLDTRFDAIEESFDGRLGALDAKLDHRTQVLEDKFERRIDALEDKFDRRIDGLEGRLDRRNDALEDKMSRQFSWLVGVQVTTLVAIVGALLARS